jgi:hypothetical protein
MDPKAKLWGEGNVSVELEDTRDWLGNWFICHTPDLFTFTISVITAAFYYITNIVITSS